MSFRRRNVAISGEPTRNPPSSPIPAPSRSADHWEPQTSVPSIESVPGVRPSALDGRPTTSTGTASLDGLLSGHALGTSILLEESGTTDYAGTLLRYYAAEGVVQGHQVHVVGVGEHWGRELPGLLGEDRNEKVKLQESEKMKIAWRYEKLGEFGAGTSASGLRGGTPPYRRYRIQTQSTQETLKDVPEPFCHSFDLTKRLTLPSRTAIKFIPIHQHISQKAPFTSVVQTLYEHLSSSKLNTVHRLVIPGLLSPAAYPPHASDPKHILQFLHSIRSLLRLYPIQLTAIISLPLTLYPRTAGLVRWMEHLSDGVIELVPFPHSIDTIPSLTTSGAATSQEEKPQGIVKIHTLPVFHERGGGGAGGAGVGDDLAFTVSRRRFLIKPFSLPPVEGDTEAQKGEVEGGKTKLTVDF
ncbi:hypothetical protein MMC14_003709 [Varicellaria rhodocarpa]|nr:hypothetical protein [Varicellaria rhodocarpa]